LQQVAKCKTMERVLLVVPPLAPKFISDQSQKIDDLMAMAESLLRRYSLKAKTQIYFDVYKLNEDDPYEVIRFGRKFMVNQALETGIVISPVYFKENISWMEKITRVFPNVAPFDQQMEYLFFNLS